MFVCISVIGIMAAPHRFTSRHKPSYTEDVMSSINKLMHEGKFTDFKICSSGKVISCHRLVLAASCPYFAALLNSGMKEAEEGRVTMDTMDYDVLNNIVMYLYGDDIKFKETDIQSAIELFDRKSNLQTLY